MKYTLTQDSPNSWTILGHEPRWLTCFHFLKKEITFNLCVFLFILRKVNFFEANKTTACPGTLSLPQSVISKMKQRQGRSAHRSGQLCPCPDTTLEGPTLALLQPCPSPAKESQSPQAQGTRPPKPALNMLILGALTPPAQIIRVCLVLPMVNYTPSVHSTRPEDCCLQGSNRAQGTGWSVPGTLDGIRMGRDGRRCRSVPPFSHLPKSCRC